jgi:small subunit ribosomal protein S16
MPCYMSTNTMDFMDLQHDSSAEASFVHTEETFVPPRAATGKAREGWRQSLGSRERWLPFRLSFCIIIVCLDLAGLFRNKGYNRVLMIRLARRGARKQPHYRIVVIEKERARNGRPVEVVGTYNPRTNPASVEMKRDRIEYWVSKGAQMSDRVNKLFSKPTPAGAGTAA